MAGKLKSWARTAAFCFAGGLVGWLMAAYLDQLGDTAGLQFLAIVVGVWAFGSYGTFFVLKKSILIAWSAFVAALLSASWFAATSMHPHDRIEWLFEQPMEYYAVNTAMSLSAALMATIAAELD